MPPEPPTSGPPPDDGPPGNCGASGSSFGAPIAPAQAAKVRTETDWLSLKPTGLRFVRHYLSTWGLDNSSHFSTMGKAWRHNHDIELSQRATSSGTTVSILTGEGYVRTFSRATGTSAWTPEGHNDSLNLNVSNQWVYHRADQDDTLVFDGSGKLLSHTARNGWQTSYAYDASARLSTITGPLGQILTLAYNGTGQLISLTAPANHVTTYDYDSAGRLTQVDYPDGTARVFLYENASYPQALTGIQDANGNRWGTFAYDALGRAISTELAGGVQHYQASYPSVSTGPVAVTDPLGTTRSFTYGTQAGKLAVLGGSTPDPLGQPDAASRVQSSLGLIESETNYRGITKSFQWDVTRRLPLTTTEALGQPTERLKQTTWHPQWRLPVTITEPGRVTSYTYDSLGNLLSQTVTDTASGSTGVSRTTHWTYHPSGLVATETAPNGAVTSYQYDSAGNLTQSTNALGQVDSYTHDGAGRVLSHTAANGRVTFYTYDARGRMLTSTVGGLVTTLTYRPSGQVATATLPHGHVITYQYDAAQRLTGWSDNRGASASYALDAMGNRVQETITQQGQAVWQLARSINSLNRVQSVTLGGTTTSYGYDANGDLTQTTQNVDGTSQSTTLGLDALRRVQNITNAANATATLQYNALDAVTQASDFKGVATTYTRDALGNAPQETTPDSGTTQTTHDALGLPQTITDALGRATHITRDALGRPTQIQHSANGITRTSVLRYDLPGADYNASGSPQASIGRLSEIEDSGLITRYQRDALGRITRKTQTLANAQSTGGTRSIAYGYVPAGSPGAGRLASITYPSGKQLTHQYDATGQLSTLHWNGQPLVSNLTWNPLVQPTGWQWSGFGSGPGSSTPLEEIREYNTAGQLTGSALLDLTWDSAGRIRQIKQQHMLPGTTGGPPQVQQATITSAYSYDAAGRLTASAHSGPPGLTLPVGQTLSDIIGINTSGYSYDANGNRSQVYYSAGTPSGTATLQRNYHTASGTNRLSGYSQTHTPAGGGAHTSSVTYNHNATGALTKKGDSHLHYGVDGRIAKASQSQDPNATQAVSYSYNALAQRILKSDARLSAANPVAQQTVYAEDGEASTVLGQYSNRRSTNSNAPAGENDSTEIIYLPTAAGPMPIATQINGRLYAIDADHLNTPRRLTNQQGQVAWQWLITGFGEVNPTTGATGYTQEQNGASYSEEITFDLRYPGQVWDEETGLSYNLNRYYDRATGRYTQADPIGLAGGWNRFSYVGGNPLSFVDPDGLRPNRPQWWNDGWKPITPSGHCATAECAAGLPRTPSDNRSPEEVDFGQCKMVCQISLLAPVAMCNAAAGGGLAGTAAAAAAKGGLCTWVCK